MNAVVHDQIGERLTANQTARLLAGRLERLGHDPFLTDRHRYLVMLQDAPGEIIDLGRPLRGSRLFKPKTLARDIETVRAFGEYTAEEGRSDLLFWGIGLTGSKAEVGSLVQRNEEFNRRINVHFSELRKRNGFELLLLVIHPRYDEFSGRFDLHAHFICRIPLDQREAARRRLLTAFSKADLPDHPLRNPAACATYMVWGICPPEITTTLPDEALAELWALSRTRARLVRSGGGYAKWKRSATASPAEAARRAQRAQVKANRAATADPRPRPAWTDRLLAKVMVRVDGKRRAALLFEEAADPETASIYGGEPEPNPTPQEADPSPERYPSATSTVTQDPLAEDGPAAPDDIANPRRRSIGARIAAWTEKTARRIVTAVSKAGKAAKNAVTALGRWIIPGGDPPS